MRKRIIILLTLLLMLTVSHAESLPYAEDTVLTSHTASAAEQTLRDYLYPRLLAQEEDIDLPSGTSFDLLSQTLNDLTRSYPELFAVDITYTILYERTAPDIATGVRPQYRCTLSEAQSLRTQLLETAQAWLTVTTDPVGLHDLLISRVSYSDDTAWCATAVGALLDGQANCEGYAQALTLLYRLAGIPCGLIEGQATSSDGVTAAHAWNIAEIGGACLIDACWDDLGDIAAHWYFALSAEEMAADHQTDDSCTLPDTSAAVGYYVPHGLTANTRNELEPFLARLLGGETIEIALSDDLYAQCTADLNQFLTAYLAQTNMSVQFSYSLYAFDLRHVMLVIPSE